MDFYSVRFNHFSVVATHSIHEQLTDGFFAVYPSNALSEQLGDAQLTYAFTRRRFLTQWNGVRHHELIEL
jgi:hypothetical protein